MLQKLKTFGTGVLGLLLIVAVIVIAGVLIGGISWVSEHLLRWCVLASLIVFAIEILLLLPLSLFRRTRSFAAIGILYASFLFGVTLWMDGLVTTEILWGTGAVFLGLCLAGIGVVPLGMLASLFHRQWAHLSELAFFAALTFGSRFYAFWQAEKSNSIERDYLYGSVETEGLPPDTH